MKPRTPSPSAPRPNAGPLTSADVTRIRHDLAAGRFLWPLALASAYGLSLLEARQLLQSHQGRTLATR